MDPVRLKVTKNAQFSHLKHARQFLLGTFCDPTEGIIKLDWTWTPPYVKVEIVMSMGQNFGERLENDFR